MAQIKKLGEQRYLIRASKGTGRNRVYDNKVFDGTLKDAREEARDMEILLAKGRLAGVRFEKCRDLWLAAIKPKLSPRTVDGYEYSIKHYAKALDQLKLGRIDHTEIQKVYDSCGTLTTTIRNLHAALNAFFSWTIKRGDIKDNPCKATDRPRKTRKEIHVLDFDEAARFYGLCQKMPKGVIFEFALETGMRPEEYLALRWRDLSGNEVSVVQAMQFNRDGKGGYYFKDIKTPKGRRRVPISDSLRMRLIRHRREQNEHRLKMKGTWFDHDLIFPNSIGRPYQLTNITRRYFDPIRTACKLDRHITLYSLRHSCATLLLMSGENPKVVADRLGHASVTITLDTYSHVLPHIQADATSTIDRILRRAKL